MDTNNLYNPFYKPENSYSNPSAKTTSSYSNPSAKTTSSYSNPSAKTTSSYSNPSAKTTSSYSNQSASTSTMKPKNAKSKIKWNQIIILALILGVIGVIVYFVVDAFKKKCPDPERPVYNKTYGCIPQCDPESEIYDDNVKDCVLRKLCSEDPKKPIPYFDEGGSNSYCSGQVQFCICGPECFTNEDFNPETGECDCPGPTCPDNKCCKSNQTCFPKNDDTYLCCDADNLITDGENNAIDCCGEYSTPNADQTKCIPSCGPTTSVSKTSKACEDGICAVAVFSDEEEAQNLISELGSDVYRGSENKDGKTYVYYCYVKDNSCTWNEDSTDYLPERLPGINLLYTDILSEDEDGDFINKFSALPIDKTDTTYKDFYDDFYIQSYGFGNYCAPEEGGISVNEYRRLKRLQEDGTSCNITDCLDQLGKYKGTIRVQGDVSNRKMMCTGLYASNNEQSGLRTATICSGPNDPYIGCKNTGDIIYNDEVEDKDEEDEFKFNYCDGIPCPVNNPNNPYDCSLKTGKIILPQIDVVSVSNFENLMNIYSLDNPNSVAAKYKLVTSDGTSCFEEDETPANCGINNYGLYNRYIENKYSQTGDKDEECDCMLHTFYKDGCNGANGCKNTFLAYSSDNTDESAPTNFNIETWELKDASSSIGVDGVKEDIGEIMTNIFESSDNPPIIFTEKFTKSANRSNVVNYYSSSTMRIDNQNYGDVPNFNNNITNLALCNLISYVVNMLQYNGSVIRMSGWAFDDKDGKDEANGWGRLRRGGTKHEAWLRSYKKIGGSGTNFSTVGFANNIDEIKDDNSTEPLELDELPDGYTPQQYNIALLIYLIKQKTGVNIFDLRDEYTTSIVTQITFKIIEDYLSNNIINNYIQEEDNIIIYDFLSQLEEIASLSTSPIPTPIDKVMWCSLSISGSDTSLSYYLDVDDIGDPRGVAFAKEKLRPGFPSLNLFGLRVISE